MLTYVPRVVDFQQFYPGGLVGNCLFQLLFLWRQRWRHAHQHMNARSLVHNFRCAKINASINSQYLAIFYAYFFAHTENITCIKLFFKDVRSVSRYPYNLSQILQYVTYTKWINIVKKYVNTKFSGQKNNNTITTKQKSKHKNHCHSRELNPGPLASQSGVLPLGHRDNWMCDWVQAI